MIRSSVKKGIPNTRRPASVAFLSLGCALFLTSCAPRQVGPTENPGSSIGGEIGSLDLESIDGQKYTLEELAESPTIVLAWTGVGCPMAKVYLPRLKALAAEFKASGVRFFLINSNSQDSWQEIRNVAAEQALGFPIIRDRGGALARNLGVTPQSRSQRRYKVRYGQWIL